MERVRSNPLTFRRLVADFVIVAVVFYVVAAADALLRSGLRFSIDALPWQQFFYGVAFLPALALLVFLPAALVIGVVGATRRRVFVAGLILGLAAGFVAAEVTGVSDSLYLLWASGLLGGFVLSATRPPDRHVTLPNADR
jgi:hypothetical protein